MNRLTLKEAYIGRFVGIAVAGVLTLGIAVGAYKANRREYHDGMPSMGLTAAEMKGWDGMGNKQERDALESFAIAEAERWNLRPALVCALIEHESDWQPGAVNPESGAAGLMQMMPETWVTDVRELELACRFGVLDPDEYGSLTDITDPHDNIRAGCHHLWKFKHEAGVSRWDEGLMLDIYALGYCGAMERFAEMGAGYKPVSTSAAIIRLSHEIEIEWDRELHRVFTEGGSNGVLR